MRIVPLGSGGAILDLDWFLNYRDIKLAIQVSEMEGKDDFQLMPNIEAISALRLSKN
jgi:hypothetical protein